MPEGTLWTYLGLNLHKEVFYEISKVFVGLVSRSLPFGL